MGHTPVLIVDDNPKNLQVVGQMLLEEGIEAEFATNGETALEWIRERDFKLILLDVMMPGMDGYEVCREIRKDPENGSIPIIFLTARTDTESIVQGFDTGAVDYITKPFNKKELLARVSTHLMLKKAHDDIENYLEEITLKNKLLTYSVQYASRIQNAILPPPELVEKLLPDYFILYLPRDIVSGDFYWIKEIDDSVLVAVADCTGHGVPGAFMSMLGYTGLNQAVDEYGLTNPNEILNHLHQFLKNALQKKKTECPVFDGMDITLCRLFPSGNTMECCSANHTIYLFKKGEMQSIRGERVTIGDVDYDALALNNHNIKLSKGDAIYMLTDGYTDQFGGDSGKKFSTRRLTELLGSIRNDPCSRQSDIMRQAFYDWKKDQEQIDDVSVLGIRF